MDGTWKFQILLPPDELVKDLVLIQIGCSSAYLPPHKRDTTGRAVREVHFLFGILEIPKAHQETLGRDNDKGLDAHSRKRVEDKHGLLAWKPAKIE